MAPTWMEVDGVMHRVEWVQADRPGGISRWRRACWQQKEPGTKKLPLGAVIYCRWCHDTPHGVAV